MFDIFNAMPPDPQWHTILPRGTSGQSWMYPIMIILGFVVAIVLACLKLWKRYKVSIEPFYWFILIGVPTAILGANFGSCVLGPPAGKPWSEFFTRFGQGLAIEWGVILTVIVAFIYFPLVLRKPKYRVRDEFGPVPAVKQVSLWMYFDAVAPCILLAQFLGRWGNYFNQEVYGAVLTSNQEGLAWFLYKCLPGMYISGKGWCQPLFFWEGIGNLVMFFVLYFGIEYIKQRKAGDLAASYLVWYGTFRAGLETLRDPQFMSQSSIILSSVFAVIGALFIIFNHVFGTKYRKHYGFKIFFSSFWGNYVSYLFASKKSLQNNLKWQNKIIKKCEKKISHYYDVLNNQLTDLNNSTIFEKREKTKKKIELWELRLNESKTRLSNIENNICTWDFPKDFNRADNELIYYGRW